MRPGRALIACLLLWALLGALVAFGWAPLPKPSQHSLWFQVGGVLAAVRVPMAPLSWASM